MINNYDAYFDVAALIAKHIGNKLTDEEKIILENWLQADPVNAKLFKKITADATANLPQYPDVVNDKAAAWQNIVSKTGIKYTPNSVIKLKNWGAYAAAIILPLAIGIMLFAHQGNDKKKYAKQLAHQQNDLKPGGNKAVLTLANGSKINLDNARDGEIAREPDAIVDKTGDGELVYNTKKQPAEAPEIAEAINIISTPRGGQYKLVLADGTKVWLNAASSLKYPTAFAGNERNVELTGEAYFEVAKNAAKPFFVKTANQTVEVLGTHFNINSYTDEKATKTTLLEGSVKVTGNFNKVTVKLVPGQQAVNASGSISITNDADIDEAVAWKNGKFLFKNAGLQAIMRQISRWYDVDVAYQGNIAERHYEGRISRDVPVSQIFMILKTSGLNFTINGGKIIVKP
ncbi:FecR family protein [Mucilaginibacter sp.]|uniref:FecR family protein n=1 Tax=Mucilaginibacter sp. TaxID=1882438 RepID=UPI003D09B07B